MSSSYEDLSPEHSEDVLNFLPSHLFLKIETRDYKKKKKILHLFKKVVPRQEITVFVPESKLYGVDTSGLRFIEFVDHSILKRPVYVELGKYGEKKLNKMAGLIIQLRYLGPSFTFAYFVKHVRSIANNFDVEFETLMAQKNEGGI